MPSLVRRAALLIVLAAAGSCRSRDEAPTRPRYPAARMVAVVDDYHGTRVPDPYRWLEDLQSPEVQRWAAAQTTLARPFLQENAVRPWLLARVDSLAEFWKEPGDDSRETSPLGDVALSAGQSIDDVWVAPDKRHAVYTVSTNGSEWVDTRIRRLTDSTDLGEHLEDLLWSDASWTKDSRGFFHVRSLKPSPGERVLRKGPVVYYHRLGTPQSEDVAILRMPPTEREVELEQELSDDGRYLFIYEGNGAHVESIGWLLTRMHVLDLGDPLRPAIGGTVVPLSAARDAAYRVVATTGDSIYLFTDRDAPRRRVVVFSLANPSVDAWRDVVPESADLIDDVIDIHGRFMVQTLRNVQNGMTIYERSGRRVRELPIPPMTVIERARAGAANEVVLEMMEGFSPTRRRYDVVTGRMTVERAPRLPIGAEVYEIRQVWYPSKDGVKVPMFLAHRRDLVRDGSHPVVLAGYGASSQLALPYLDEYALASLEMGLVIALPALRGGGEFGRAWYEAAILERKQTTLDDFIAAAEYLVREKYTSPARLAITGASNGGLLVTAVINQRPDLFRVAVAGVPQTDNLRYDRGRHNTQFGNPKDPAHFPFLLAYSPVHNVKPNTCHPATLITTALNDDRAPAWMALKYTATLQAAQSCDRPVILRADTGGGHIGDERNDAADFIAFVASQLGVTRPGMVPVSP
ncbi:MAG: prolyl oligopeptidase family serine peptidase [Gemmatimonadota bacterium]